MRDELNIPPLTILVLGPHGMTVNDDPSVILNKKASIIVCVSHPLTKVENDELSRATSSFGISGCKDFKSRTVILIPLTHRRFF